MNSDLQRELRAAIYSEMSLEEIVALLRRLKQRGVQRSEVYSVLGALRDDAPDEAVDDRIVEVADFVAGFCSPHMRVWED